MQAIISYGTIEDMVEIKKVESAMARGAFVSFPKKLFKANKFYVAPCAANEKALVAKKCPTLEGARVGCFLAYKNGKVAGRVAVVIPAGEGRATMTRLDFIDDYNVSSELLKHASTFVVDSGANLLMGPLNFYSDGHAGDGILVEGFDRMATADSIYNYGYYDCHIEKAGFKKEYDVLESEDDAITEKEKKSIGDLLRRRRVYSKMIAGRSQNINLADLTEK